MSGNRFREKRREISEYRDDDGSLWFEILFSERSISVRLGGTSVEYRRIIGSFSVRRVSRFVIRLSFFRSP